MGLIIVGIVITAGGGPNVSVENRRQLSVAEVLISTNRLDFATGEIPARSLSTLELADHWDASLGFGLSLSRPLSHTLVPRLQP